MSCPTTLSETSTPKSQPKLKLKQASRSVSNLTPDQLQRKRAQDRESQRQTRLRVKRTIADLEKRVEELTENLQCVRLENASLQNAPTAPPTIPLPQPISDPGNLSYQAMDMGSMDMVGQHGKEDQYGWIDMLSMDTVGQHGNDEYQYGSMSDNSGTVLLSSCQVWEVCPMHSDLSVMVRATKCALEFSNNLEDLFLSALLNPQSDSSQVPLVGEVVSMILASITSLPEQIAIIYEMCFLCRWINTRSKGDYYAMPEWLRPQAAQIVTPHQFWVDMIPWQKLRDEVCGRGKYQSGHDTFNSEYIAAISVSWPYPILIQAESGDHIIHPGFISHIRKIDNWTLDAEFVEKYKCEGKANVRSPSSSLHALYWK